MKNFFLVFSVLLINACAASVDPAAFLVQVKGKNILNEGSTMVAGSFSPDGMTFNFAGGTIPMRLSRATSNNEAEYREQLLESVTRAYMTVNGQKITIDVQNGTPPQTFDLASVTPTP